MTNIADLATARRKRLGADLYDTRVSQTLAALRLEAGLSLETVATRLALPVAKIAAFEAGTLTVPAGMLLELAVAFDKALSVFVPADADEGREFRPRPNFIADLVVQRTKDLAKIHAEREAAASRGGDDDGLSIAEH